MGRISFVVVAVLLAGPGGVAFGGQGEDPMEARQVRNAALSTLIAEAPRDVALLVWSVETTGTPVRVSGINPFTHAGVEVPGVLQFEQQEFGGLDFAVVEEVVVLRGAIQRCFYHDTVPLREIEVGIGFDPDFQDLHFFRVQLEDGCTDVHTRQLQVGDLPGNWKKVDFLTGEGSQEDTDPEINADPPARGNALS